MLNPSQLFNLSFPEKWTPKFGLRILLYGYVTSYIITIGPLFVLPIFKGVESWRKFVEGAFGMLVWGIFSNLVNFFPVVVLAISWSIYFKLKTDKSFNSNHAWGILGGCVVFLALLAALNWSWWWDVWEKQYNGAMSPYDLMAVSILLLIPLQFYFISLGTCIGLLVGNYYEVYPTLKHFILVLFGASSLAFIGINWYYDLFQY